MNPLVPLQMLDMPSPPQSPALTGKYRRNGKLQSCEPCRKSKLRCDHTVPTCGRCIKRRCAEQCVYHPNPLTQDVVIPKKSHSKVYICHYGYQNLGQAQTTRHTTPKRPLPTPSISTTPTNHESPATVLPSIETSNVEFAHASAPVSGPLFTYTAETAPQQHRAASAPPLRAEQEAVNRRHQGFLGVTSYSSIFSENLGQLGVVAADLETSEIKKIQVPVDRFVRGCQVLSFLKDRVMINRFVTRWFEICGGSGFMLIEPIIKQWLLNFWLYWSGSYLTEPDPQKLQQLCELLWRNTQTPLVFDGNISAKEWIRLGTGVNVRWEVIGCISVIVGLCASTLDPSDSLFREHKVSRSTLPTQMSDIAQACLSFCRHCDALDDMFIWLLLENQALTSSIRGDGSYNAYQESGELISAVIAMGLHQEIKPNDRTPFFLTELRKRAFLATYLYEIGMAAFLGRPPRITYRYCVLDPPLDLTDKQLVLDKPELDAIIAQLDENGFNSNGMLNRGTWMRAWVWFGTRREDIIDLALSNYTREEIQQKAEAIQAKTEESWAKLPEFIRKTRHEVPSSNQTPLEILHRAIIRQGTRANDLLLQRVLIRKTGASSEKLIHVAQAIFKEVILVGQRHDLASNFQMDVTGILVVHGLRCAAIIAVELLKQEQQQLPRYPKTPLLLPRSQTIQDLSVFAARLGAVDPADGMHNVCEQGRKVITRILDKILTPPPPPVVAERQATTTQDQPEGMDVDNILGAAGASECCDPAEVPFGMATFGDVNFAGMDGSFAPHDNDYMFMQWLENMDWERSSPLMGLYQYH